MQTIATALFLLACSAVLPGQVAAILDRSPAGAPEIRVQNNARTPLAALAVAMNPSSSAEDTTQFVAFFDAVVDKTSSLEPGRQRTIPVPHRTRPGKQIEQIFDSAVIAAGILENGTTFGDPVLLTRLMVRRSNMLLAVETALEMLADAGRHNIPREQLTGEFRKQADSAWRWYVPPEQQVGRALYYSIVEKLKNVPDGPPGTPFPPSAFVAEETAKLNRDRVAILESQPHLTTATLFSGR